jgi:hypothetical protein
LSNFPRDLLRKSLLFLTIQPEDQLGIDRRNATWAIMPGPELIPPRLPLTRNQNR